MKLHKVNPEMEMTESYHKRTKRRLRGKKGSQIWTRKNKIRKTLRVGLAISM